MKVALDPTPFHHSHSLLELPGVVADLGYEYLQLTPHVDMIPFFNHPKADDALVAKFRKACADAGVGIASVLPVLRWSGPDEDAREAAVRYWKRAIQITVDLGVNVMNTEFSGRPEKPEESEVSTLVEGDGPHALAWREWTDPAEIDTADGSFETHGVLDALEALRSDTVPLGGGASMHVEPTRALVAVDVNTGGDTSPAAGLKANMAALRDLPRQLRLRGLGGQITIDPAPCPKKDRKQIEGVLRAALRADTVETVLVGWTPMGNLELQRKRDRIALTEVLP